MPRHYKSMKLLNPFSGFIVFLVAMVCTMMLWNSVTLKTRQILQQKHLASEPVQNALKSLLNSFHEFLFDSNEMIGTSDTIPELDNDYFVLEESRHVLQVASEIKSIGSTQIEISPGTSLWQKNPGVFVLESSRISPATNSIIKFQWQFSSRLSELKNIFDVLIIADGQVFPLKNSLIDSHRVGTYISEASSRTGFLQLANQRKVFLIEDFNTNVEIIYLFDYNIFEAIPWISTLAALLLFLSVIILSIRLRRVRDAILHSNRLSPLLFMSDAEINQKSLDTINLPINNEGDLIHQYGLQVRRQIQEAMDSVNAGIVFSKNNQLIYLNKTARRIFPLDPLNNTDLTVDTLIDLLDNSQGQKAPDFQTFIESLPTEGKLFRIEKPDNKRWIHLSCTSISIEKEDFHVITVLDQTLTKEIEQRIQTQYDFFNSILESISDPLYVIETDTRQVVIRNRAAKELMESKRSNCQALNPESRACENRNQLCPFELSRLTKVSSIVERLQISKSGKKKYFEIHGHPILDSNDNVTHVIEYQLDVTERKQADQILRESEERYSSLFEKNNSVMILYNPEDGRIVDANPAACEFYGYSRDEFSQKHIVDINTMSPFELYREMQKAKQEGRHQLYFEHRLANGERRDVEAFTGVIKVSGHNLNYQIVYDITDRRRAERQLQNLIDIEALTASISTRFIRLQAVEIDEQITEALAEIGGFAGFDRCLLLITDSDFSQLNHCYEWCVPNRTSIRKKLKEQGFINLSWLNNFDESSLSIFSHDIRTNANKGLREIQFWQELGIEICHYVPFHVSHGNLGLLIFENSTRPESWNPNYDSVIRIVAELFNNALEKKYFEQQLLENQQVLKSLSTHIQDKIESVRSSIARELHDELGQLMTALKFDVRFIRKKIEQKQHAKVSEPLDSMMHVIDQSIDSIQRITAELRPILLDDLGLSPAIEWHCQDFSKRTGINVRLELEDVNLGSQENTTIFRICQEALTNVARHSQAEEATVKLLNEEDGVRMRIVDNGIGISRDQLDSNSSFGIIGVKERASAIGGTVTISGNSGEGTIIDVWIPAIRKVEAGK